ncbi:MAG: hypothetical protein J2P22_04115 [Nocardioides sp.]|nr:hypothetical protein [Nocardioides sp.]
MNDHVQQAKSDLAWYAVAAVERGGPTEGDLEEIKRLVGRLQDAFTAQQAEPL